MQKNICPYCSNELEEGKLIPPNSGTARWIPFLFSGSFFLTPRKILMKKGGFVLKSHSLFSVIEIPTMYCRNCDVFIIFGDDVNK